jgi:hypothetical protein
MARQTRASVAEAAVCVPFSSSECLDEIYEAENEKVSHNRKWSGPDVILLTDSASTAAADIDNDVNNTRLAGEYLFRSLFTALTSNIVLDEN